MIWNGSQAEQNAALGEAACGSLGRIQQTSIEVFRAFFFFWTFPRLKLWFPLQTCSGHFDGKRIVIPKEHFAVYFHTVIPS